MAQIRIALSQKNEWYFPFFGPGQLESGRGQETKPIGEFSPALPNAWALVLPQI